MIYGSICSGIESATVAWHTLGWRPAFFAEIEPFPCAVLAHHYPCVENRGDITKFAEWPDAVFDVLVGGTPCQSFSVAGLRKGLADPRGNLALVYLAIAARYRPRWLVWENVPGILSADGGRAFGSFVGGLGELGYGYAWRVLDAQYFGLAQRRKRVFLVGCLRGWAPAAAVLFEPESLRGHPAPSRQSRPNLAGTITASTRRCSADGDGGLVVAHSLRADGFDASEGGTGRGTPLVVDVVDALDAKAGDGYSGQDAYNGKLLAFGGNNTTGPIPVATSVRAKGGTGHNDFESETFICFDDMQVTSAENRSNPRSGDPSPTLAPTARPPAIAFNARQDPDAYFEHTGAIDTYSTGAAISHGPGVRRLTPRECERLQGFPDDYTFVPYRGKPAADGPRYKALGNSKAVPVVRWIGQRMEAVEQIVREHAA